MKESGSRSNGDDRHRLTSPRQWELQFECFPFQEHAGAIFRDDVVAVLALILPFGLTLLGLRRLHGYADGQCDLG